METTVARVRQNFLADIVAAIAAFLIAAGWYSHFQAAWLAGCDRTLDYLKATGVNPALQYGASLLAAFVMAVAISCVTQASGPQTAWRGIKSAILLWLGFVVTAFATEYVFELRTWTFFAITIGFWFIAMVVMGAIVGAWQKK